MTSPGGPPALRCTLRERREARGLSGAALALQVGISRQALSRIERGAAVPGTLLALQLARTLDCRVEDLFSLRAPQVEARLSGPAPAGTRVQLAELDGGWRALPLAGEAGLRAPADGVLVRCADGMDSAAGMGGTDGRGVVEVLGSLDSARRTALVAGCDPALGLLCERTGGDARAAWVPGASLDALRAAARGEVHAAGLHLGPPEHHRALVARELPGARLLRLWLAEQGLMLRPGQALRVRQVTDLRRDDLRLVTRAPGAGGRALLDAWLAQAGLTAAQRSARHEAATVAASPLDAAARVARGEADVAPGPRSAASAYGLPFVPLAVEAFDLAVPERHLGHPGVLALLAAARSSTFREDLRSLGGYDPAGSGAPWPEPPAPEAP